MEEQRGNLKGAAESWDQLAQVIAAAGRPAEAAEWYRKAIAALQQAGDRAGAAKTLNNLAGLLLQQADPVALAEARRLAEESLAIKETIDPAAAEIWLVYNRLAQIAAQQGEPERAAEYRAKARAAQAGFAGTRHQLKQHGPLILTVVGAAAEPDKYREALQQALARYGDSWGNLKAAVRRLLDGERDEETLCEPLDMEDSMIIHAILEGIADPASLADLLSQES